MNVAIYDIASGKIKRLIDAPASVVDMQCQDGEEFYLNCPPTATHIINNEPVTIAPPPPATDELLVKIRWDRDRRLSNSDWTQLDDSQVNKVVWAKYRQALRDFPATCDPHNPVWPTPPTK